MATKTTGGDEGDTTTNEPPADALVLDVGDGGRGFDPPQRLC